MNDIEYIRSKLDMPELLTQVAEEAAELAQAALKLRRAIDGTNPTPTCCADRKCPVCSCLDYEEANDDITLPNETEQEGYI